MATVKGKKKQPSKPAAKAKKAVTVRSKVKKKVVAKKPAVKATKTKPSAKGKKAVAKKSAPKKVAAKKAVVKAKKKASVKASAKSKKVVKQPVKKPAVKAKAKKPSVAKPASGAKKLLVSKKEVKAKQAPAKTTTIVKKPVVTHGPTHQHHVVAPSFLSSVQTHKVTLDKPKKKGNHSIVSESATATKRHAPTKSSNLGTMGIPPYQETKGEVYMGPQQLAHFKKILLRWKEELMQGVDSTIHHMQDDAANFPDPNDRATQEEEFSLELRARDRDRKLIKKIEEALQKIENEEYGFCDECGVEIGIRRLEARPTATLCIDCKTLDEIKERQLSGG